MTTRAAAVLTVRANSRDMPELVEFLAMLGLIEDPDGEIQATQRLTHEDLGWMAAHGYLQEATS